MPDIYAHAWNVIAWLGESRSVEGDLQPAVNALPTILNLRALDSILKQYRPVNEILVGFVAFTKVLLNPWFNRRWVIREAACAQRLSVRIGENVLSWLDFADAIELYTDKINSIRKVYKRSDLYLIDPRALDGIEESSAVALIELSRNVFQKRPDPTSLSRLMDLHSLVLSASSFAISDLRDTIYALLYLANDRTKYDCAILRVR